MAGAVQSGEGGTSRHHDEIAQPAQRVRALLEHTSDGLVLFDREMNFVYASAVTARMLGVTNDQLTGRSAFDFIHPGDRQGIESWFTALAATPRGFSAASFRIQPPDGPCRSIEAEASNLLDDPDVGAIVGKYRDVTEARAADEAMRRIRDELGRLSRAIEQTADSVFVTDRDGVIEYVNPAFELMTGYARDEVVGRTPRILQSGLQPPRFYTTLWTTIMSGEVFRTVITNKRKDGRLYDEDQTITPIRDEAGVITHFVSTGRDITQRRRTQDAMRRLNSQLENESTRIAGVLHDEAGQFLTAAHLQLAELTEALPRDLAGKAQEVRRTLDQVEEQLRRVSHEIHPRIVEDLGLIEAISFCAQSFMRRTGINIGVMAMTDRRYPLPVETLLYRLVQEALTNMSRHAQARTGTVTLSGDEQGVCCSVRDNGIGFDVAAVEARVSGGLGLRLMQDRLEAVGGALTITSAPGHGTELVARVPMEGLDGAAHPAG
jgi:two-component system sensor histidine kinase NreB